MDANETADALGALDDATRAYRRTERAHALARQTTIEAVLDALRAGARPTDVVAGSPFTPAYIRRLAREAGIGPRVLVQPQDDQSGTGQG